MLFHGIKPNLFIIFILFIGLFLGPKVGLSLGAFLGIFLDLLVGKKIGIFAFMYASIGILGGYLDKNFSKESKLTFMLIVMGGTMFFEIGICILNILFLKTTLELGYMAKIIFIEMIYNMMITIILYPFIQKTGFYIENVFKDNKILTRYF